MDKKRALEIILIIFTLGTALVLFWSVDRAINVPDSSTWLVPMLWGAIFFVFSSLSFVLIKNRLAVEMLIAGAFLSSFVFSFDLSRIATFILAFLLASVAILRIRKELGMTMKINISRDLHAGKSFFIAAAALVISSQYYSEIKNNNLQTVIPKFEFGTVTGKLTSEALSAINPQFKLIQDENLTVDGFLARVQTDQAGQVSGGKNLSFDGDKEISTLIEKQGFNLTPAEKEQLKNEALARLNDSKNQLESSSQFLALQEGRKKLSELSGFTLIGNEKISEVFSGVINKKISGYFQPTLVQNPGLPLIPLTLALVLFLTVVPLANMLSWVVFPAAKLLFGALARQEVIRIKKVPAEVEVIE